VWTMAREGGDRVTSGGPASGRAMPA